MSIAQGSNKDGKKKDLPGTHDEALILNAVD